MRTKILKLIAVSAVVCFMACSEDGSATDLNNNPLSPDIENSGSYLPGEGNVDGQISGNENPGAVNSGSNNPDNSVPGNGNSTNSGW